jgi:hypothetical protein
MTYDQGIAEDVPSMDELLKIRAAAIEFRTADLIGYGPPLKDMDAMRALNARYNAAESALDALLGIKVDHPQTDVFGWPIQTDLTVTETPRTI